MSARKLMIVTAMLCDGCRVNFDPPGVSDGGADGSAGGAERPATNCASAPGYEDLGTGCYRLEDVNHKTIRAAEPACEAEGGHLAVIESAADNAAIYARWPVTASIGLVNPGTGYVWVTGEVPSYLYWNADSPAGTEQCVRLLDTNGNWQDARCGGTQRYICEIDGRTATVSIP